MHHKDTCKNRSWFQSLTTVCVCPFQCVTARRAAAKFWSSSPAVRPKSCRRATSSRRGSGVTSGGRAKRSTGARWRDETLCTRWSCSWRHWLRVRRYQPESTLCREFQHLSQIFTQLMNFLNTAITSFLSPVVSSSCLLCFWWCKVRSGCLPQTVWYKIKSSLFAFEWIYIIITFKL